MPRPTSGSSASREAGQTKRPSMNDEALSDARVILDESLRKLQGRRREQGSVVDQAREERDPCVLEGCHHG